MNRKHRGGEKMREEIPLRERILRGLDMPLDLLPGETLLELRGRGQMLLRGCGPILIYTSEEIRVGLKRGCLSVRGRELICTSYRRGAVGVEGRISSVSFEEV